MNETPSHHGPSPIAPSRARAGRRFAIRAGLLLILSGILGRLVLRRRTTAPTELPRAAGSQRILSLSPGVTETVEALGAAEQLVGISDYCEPTRVPDLPRAGTALTPNYEVIAELSPDVILTSEVKGAQLGPLQKLARTEQLPWLSLAEWLSSIGTMGHILGKQEAAQVLRHKIASTLLVKPKTDAPRILLSLDYGDTGSDETWFIREDSIHGAVLSAAGAQNAVKGEVIGHPQLSPERLLEVDPDGILVLSSRPGRTRADVRAHFARWAPLKAVVNERIGVISVPGALTVGPSVLKLVPLLRKEIVSLMGGKP